MCSLPVEVSMSFWAAFLLSVILRWLPPPPRVWSLAASFSCSASPKLACLEPGVSPGVGGWVCARCGRPCMSMCMQVCLPTQALSPPCLASKRSDRNGPHAGPSKAPVSDYPYLIQCASGPLPAPPPSWACCFWPASLVEENTGLWEMF